MNGIYEISTNDFKSTIDIRMNTVLEGLDNFDNITLDIDNSITNYEKELLITDFIKKLFSNSTTYIDFYLSKLNELDYIKLLDSLNEEDKVILNSLYKENYRSIYFKVTSIELLEFFIRLSANNLFFITFYFKNPDITVWSNYNYNFLIFYNSHDALEIVKSNCNTSLINFI